MRFDVMVMALLLLAAPPARAAQTSESVWNWYLTFFVSPFPGAKTQTFSGTASLVITGKRIEARLTDAIDPEGHGIFSGEIRGERQIRGKLRGVLLEEPRAMTGRRFETKFGKCRVDVIVLGETFRHEFS